MDKLRNIGIGTLAVIALLAVIGIIAAFYELWLLAIGLLFCAVLVSVLATLILARYIARNARTGEQRTKTVTQKLAARVKKAVEEQEQANAELVRGMEKGHQALSQQLAEHHKTVSALQESIAKLDEKMVSQIQENVASQNKNIQRHITTTTRDSTRQVESLIHLYQRYPEVKLPMPNTGGYAIDSQALAHLLALVEERQPRRILELGSGTSTIWMGYLCRSFGGKLVTLDHLEHYLGLTQTAIDRHQLHDVVEARLAPLEPTECDGKSFNWYSLDAIADLTDIDMVIADGPPASTGPQARYPSLPKLINILAPTATLILDDAHRKDEAEIVESWLADFSQFREIEKGTSRLAVLERSAG